jgi:hypothetical protein
MYTVISFHRDVQIHGHPCCLEVSAKWEEQSGCCAVATVFDVRAKLSGADSSSVSEQEKALLAVNVSRLFKQVHERVLALSEERNISLLLAFDGDEGSNAENYYSVPTEVAFCRTRSYCQCMGFDVVDQLQALKSHTTQNLFSTYALELHQGHRV